MSYLADALEVFKYEIQALEAAQTNIASTFEAAVQCILDCKGKVVMTGVGKSNIIAHKNRSHLGEYGNTCGYISILRKHYTVIWGMVSRGDVVVMLSKSATTIELIKMLPTLRKLDVKTIGIFGNTSTRLAQNMDILLDASVNREACPLNLAPMSSTTVALVIGDALAAALMNAKNFQAKNFAFFHPAGQLGRNLLLTARDVMHQDENLPILNKENKLKEVVVKMTQFNLGAVCICAADGTLEGIITDGDIRRWFSEHDNLNALAQDLMTKNPVSLQPEMKLMEVISIMENPHKQIYVAPVKDAHGKCVGLVRMHDVLTTT